MRNTLRVSLYAQKTAQEYGEEHLYENYFFKG